MFLMALLIPSWPNKTACYKPALNVVNFLRIMNYFGIFLHKVKFHYILNAISTECAWWLVRFLIFRSAKWNGQIFIPWRRNFFDKCSGWRNTLSCDLYMEINLGKACLTDWLHASLPVAHLPDDHDQYMAIATCWAWLFHGAKKRQIFT